MLLHDRLDYWPGRMTWRWRDQMTTGDVHAFIAEREAGKISPETILNTERARHVIMILARNNFGDSDTKLQVITDMMLACALLAFDAGLNERGLCKLAASALESASDFYAKAEKSAEADDDLLIEESDDGEGA